MRTPIGDDRDLVPVPAATATAPTHERRRNGSYSVT